jgi:hypothetical protein
MKNKCNVPLVRLFGTQSHWLCAIALVAVIGFSMTACEDPNPDDVLTHEEKEANTAGRLTITGLSAYNGKELSVDSVNVNDDDDTYSKTLWCIKTASNIYWYKNGKLDSITGGDVVFGTTITGSSVSLKVFLVKDGNAFESYTGNDQNVKFLVDINIGGETGWVTGYVTVNFSNGQASGAFVSR